MPRNSTEAAARVNLGNLNPKRAKLGRFSLRTLRGGMYKLTPNMGSSRLRPTTLDEGAGGTQLSVGWKP